MSASDDDSWKQVRIPRKGEKSIIIESSEDDESENESPSVTPRASTDMTQNPVDLIRRTTSLLQESLPRTTSGWAAFVSAVGSVIFGNEVLLQTQLSREPRLYGQIGDGPMRDIYHQMATSHDSILRKPFRPRLFIGTRAAVASTAAYLFPGPVKENIEFREVIQMTLDGATVAIDWELSAGNTTDYSDGADAMITNIKEGPITKPIVLVLHGMNNHSNFGYLRSMKRACCRRGWIAAGVNMRGCGGIALTTPRTYNGAYTADIRCIVQRISARLATHTPIFLVGNSLSASIVCKYLGEEGLCGTLPSCVAGGAALGNPMWMRATNLDFVSPVLAIGQKKLLLENWAALRKNNDSHFQTCVRRALRAITMAQFDEAMAPVMARNDPVYPFGFRVGHKDAKSLRNDASSFRLSRFISVPFLQLVAKDDFLIYDTFKSKLAYSISNPNILVMETKCGGHLGWQQSNSGQNSSWADTATTDFIDAAFDAYHRRNQSDSQVDTYFSSSDDRVRFSRRPFLRSNL